MASRQPLTKQVPGRAPKPGLPSLRPSFMPADPTNSSFKAPTPSAALSNPASPGLNSPPHTNLNGSVTLERTNAPTGTGIQVHRSLDIRNVENRLLQGSLYVKLPSSLILGMTCVTENMLMFVPNVPDAAPFTIMMDQIVQAKLLTVFEADYERCAIMLVLRGTSRPVLVGLDECNASEWVYELNEIICAQQGSGSAVSGALSRQGSFGASASTPESSSSRGEAYSAVRPSGGEFLPKTKLKLPLAHPNAAIRVATQMDTIKQWQAADRMWDMSSVPTNGSMS